MRVTALAWASFRLPLRQTFASSTGSLQHRDGLILKITTDRGMAGIGEASPLPERGGSLAEALAILEEAGPALVGGTLEDIDQRLSASHRDRPALASVRCAFDIALCDAIARARGLPVARLLAAGAGRSVEVNATVGALSVAAAAAAAAEARAAGFRCVKLKVGLARDIAEESARVAAVRQALGPDISLRIDANGAWSVEQAVSTIRELERYGLEWVEQPVPAGNLEAMACVRKAVNVAIAADEDVTSIAAARRVLGAGAAGVLVLKPMVLGGLRPAYQTARVAAAARALAAVTTTLDAGVATAAALHLAAALPARGAACGLATGSLLTGDLITRPLSPRDGRMEVPAGPGLGVEVAEDQMRRYGSGVRGEVR